MRRLARILRIPNCSSQLLVAVCIALQKTVFTEWCRLLSLNNHFGHPFSGIPSHIAHFPIVAINILGAPSNICTTFSGSSLDRDRLRSRGPNNNYSSLPSYVFLFICPLNRRKLARLGVVRELTLLSIILLMHIRRILGIIDRADRNLKFHAVSSVGLWDDTLAAWLKRFIAVPLLDMLLHSVPH